ncbi:hypothetical protein FHR24_000859 [Wenyingzhuangia heitensis]|uniref:LemA protein n=1 Tax=Wenyingzhuangia heitensis TaxID=1487859 RepID=A0ABX0U912_9FLAO|nr:hypothetical protein [Wenyingzhuangia heitensis]NIJ44420.1 hypothetical protein [Wenyingzhuangia heitensis]
MKQSLLAIIIVIVTLSCKNDNSKQETEAAVVSDEKYFNAKDEVMLFDSIAVAEVVYKDSIATWKGYFKVQENLKKFKKTSPNEVLGASDEFVKDVQLMRDSITIPILRERGMRARINALYNQALRLQEMKSIPAITVPEVTKQTQGLFSIFRMINYKVNAIYEQVNFEKDLVKDDFFFSKIDSIH